jgi:hypothetical protein
MTAATQGRLGTVQLDPGKPIPYCAVYPVKAAAKIYQGTMVSIDATGYAVPASAVGTQKVVGVCQGPGDTGLNSDVDNTAGANGAQTVRVVFGAFPFVANSTIALTDMQKPVYAVDDSTVDLSDNGGTRPFAGVLVSMDTLAGTTGLGAFVLVGPLAQLAFAIAAGGAFAPSTVYKARNVVTSLQAYTGTGTNVLTETANGAWAAQDGVTNAVGDVVFIFTTTTNLVGALDSGPWQITSLGSAGSKWVLTRPSWFTTGSTIPQGSTSTSVVRAPRGRATRGVRSAPPPRSSVRTIRSSIRASRR